MTTVRSCGAGRHDRETSSREVAVIAPLRRELRPLLRRTAARRIGSLPFGELYAGRLGDRTLTLAVAGDGAARFAAGLEAFADALRPRRVLLIGVAGGLSPELAVGEVVGAGCVLELASGGVADEWTPPSANGARSATPRPGTPRPGTPRIDTPRIGTVVTAERIVGLRREKGALWRRLGEPARAVVDLESARFARFWDGRFWEARSHAERPIEWAILRAVSDPQSEDLPLDFAAASDDGGHVVGHRLARQLAADPGAVGALRSLRRRVTQCAEQLADAAVEWIEGARA